MPMIEQYLNFKLKMKRRGNVNGQIKEAHASLAIKDTAKALPY